MRFLENAASARELKLADGLAIYNVGTSRSARSYEPLPEEPQARENQVEARLVDAAADFMENHVIQLRMPKSTVEDMKRSLEEGQYQPHQITSHKVHNITNNKSHRVTTRLILKKSYVVRS